MGAPPLLHTLSGRDRFLKNIQLLVLCLRLSGEGYCKYETVISRDKEDKEEEWEVIIHLLNNDFAQQEHCIEGPQPIRCLWFRQRFFKFQKNREQCKI